MEWRYVNEEKYFIKSGPGNYNGYCQKCAGVPDICPREQEFVEIMKQIRKDLVKIVHGDEREYTAVLFCGSGTISMDVCLNSLLLKISFIVNPPRKEYPS